MKMMKRRKRKTPLKDFILKREMYTAYPSGMQCKKQGQEERSQNRGGQKEREENRGGTTEEMLKRKEWDKEITKNEDKNKNITEKREEKKRGGR